MEGPSKNIQWNILRNLDSPTHTFLDPSPSVGFVRSGDSHHDGWEDASPLCAGQWPPQCVARGPADVPRGWNCCSPQGKDNEIYYSNTYSNIILSVGVARKWRFMPRLESWLKYRDQLVQIRYWSDHDSFIQYSYPCLFFFCFSRWHGGVVRCYGATWGLWLARAADWSSHSQQWGVGLRNVCDKHTYLIYFWKPL